MRCWIVRDLIRLHHTRPSYFTVFEVAGCDGSIRRRAGVAPLDYEDLPQIDLLINATDGYGFALANITIFVEDVDEPPVLDTLPTGLDVRENASNQVRLQADPNPGTRELLPSPLGTLHPRWPTHRSKYAS